MRLGPFVITRRKDSDYITRPEPTYVFGPQPDRGWWPVLQESFAGAWQKGVRAAAQDVMSYGTVWACHTLIADDISKNEFQLLQKDADGIRTPVTVAAYSPVLARPNHYQNRINFIESWILSKLRTGNTYVLKARDNRRVVTGLYVLDPVRVKPLVAPNGDVYYGLDEDRLAEIGRVVVPATEIIHDRWHCLYHPLAGLPPIYACALAAVQALKIQGHAIKMFAHGASMSGVLSAPGAISESTAKRLEDYWNENFAGEHNIGKIAALGDGLKFEKMQMTSVDAQVIDQLKWSDERICGAYHVPPYMVAVGPPPNYNNIEALNQQYYSQCLQVLIEAMELCLEEGIGASPKYQVELDLDGLLRMDSATKMKVATDGVKGGIFTPNEGRLKFNKAPLPGGNTVYLQEQDHSLAWLERRDKEPIAPKVQPPPPEKPEPPKPPAGESEPKPEPKPEPPPAKGLRLESVLGVTMRALLEPEEAAA